jgi:hypothetical protein
VVSVSWKRLTPTGSLVRRLSSRPRLTFVARLLDAGKRTTTLRVRAPVGDRMSR